MRVEHEYHRRGALAYMAAWDVHRAKVFGRCEATSGIQPFHRLVEGYGHPALRRGLAGVRVVDNGSSHRGKAAVDRLRAAYPNTRMIHLPVQASWLNQVEIFFSVAHRKVLTPNDFAGLDQVEARLLGFHDYEQIATPLEWKSTRADLRRLLARTGEASLPQAA